MARAGWRSVVSTSRGLPFWQARVAELVDAGGLNPPDLRVMWVQIPPRALRLRLDRLPLTFPACSLSWATSGSRRSLRGGSHGGRSAL